MDVYSFIALGLLVFLILKGLTTSYIAQFFHAGNTSFVASVGSDILHWILVALCALFFIKVLGYTVNDIARIDSVDPAWAAAALLIGPVAFATALQTNIINGFFIYVCSTLAGIAVLLLLNTSISGVMGEGFDITAQSNWTFSFGEDDEPTESAIDKLYQSDSLIED